MADRVGEQFGNYRLVRLLGTGGFAEVYLGEHVLLETEAAIKVLHSKLEPEDIEKFRLEAKRVAHMRHPHIVRVLEFSLEGTTHFLVMNYAPGGTLRQRHPNGTPVPLSTVVHYVNGVAQALQYAHDHKFIHRDVKPENILLGENNEILLSDFGLSAVAHRTISQSTQAALGTVPYMAPEQIKAHARPASDQYSLGIVVYEWLSGHRPFEGNVAEIIGKHLTIPPPALRGKVPEVSSAVERVVMKALAKKPKQRYGSVQDFAAALEQASRVKPASGIKTKTLQADDPFAVDPTEKEPLEPVQPRISRRAVLAGLAGVAGLAIVGGGIRWLATSHGPAPSPSPSSSSLTPLPLGKVLYYRSHTDIVDAVAWSPDGRRIVSGSHDGTAQVWNAKDGGDPHFYTDHTDWVYAVAWSIDNKHIASGSKDGTLRVWNDSDRGHPPPYRDYSGGVQAVAWSPNGQFIAAGSFDTTVHVQKVDGGAPFIYMGHSSGVNAVAWSPDGRRIASASSDGTVQVWDAKDGGNSHTYMGHSSGVNAVAWSPDGRHIASGGDDKKVRVWDANTMGKLYNYGDHDDWVFAVAWSPDGRRVASGSMDTMVHVWDFGDGGNPYIYKGHSSSVNAVVWSPDSKRIASGSGDTTVQVWQDNLNSH